MQHEWCKDLSWNNLIKKKYKPPIIPKIYEHYFAYDEDSVSSFF